MPKTEAPRYFDNRSQIASFIGVTRMTLYRWERMHPIPDKGYLAGHYILRLYEAEVIEWLRQLWGKLSHKQRQRIRYSFKSELRAQVCSR